MESQVEPTRLSTVSTWLAATGSHVWGVFGVNNVNRRRNIALLTSLGLGAIVYYSIRRKHRKNSVENYKVEPERQRSSNSNSSTRYVKNETPRRVPQVSTTGTYLRNHGPQLASNSSSNSLHRIGLRSGVIQRNRNQASISTLASNPPQIRTTPLRTRQAHANRDYDDAGSGSDYTSVSQQQHFYNCQTAEMVRFRMPESTTYGGSQASEIEECPPEVRSEIHDCMVGIDRLLESAQLAIDSPSCTGSLVGSRTHGRVTPMSTTSTLMSTSGTSNRLQLLRQEVLDLKNRCADLNSITTPTRSYRGSRRASVSQTPDIPETQYRDEIELVPDAEIPVRIRNQPSVSAMSCLSDATEGWFSCVSGDSTPRQLSPSPSMDDVGHGVLALSEDHSPSAMPPGPSTVIDRRCKSENNLENNFQIYYEVERSFGEDDIPVRKDRSSICKCRNYRDFQIKIAILRTSFDNLLKKVSGLGNFLVLSGRFILTGTLIAAEKVPGDMQTAYDEFVAFSTHTPPEKQLDELRHRKVKMFNFFDIIIDYIILDAFTDLENPPQAVKHVLNNRWLGDRFKETALQTSVWSIIMAKKGRVRIQEGFLAHYYSLWGSVSPVLAWGFMGPKNMKLASVCDDLHRHLLGMIEDMFSFEVMDYSSQTAFDRKLAGLMLERFQHCIGLVRSHVGSLEPSEELKEARAKVERGVKNL